MSIQDLVPLMTEWATRARRDIEVAVGQVLIFSGGGELRDYIRPLGERFVLTKVERGGGEQFEMISASLMDIARYLTKTYGSSIRSSLGLPHLFLSPPPTTVAKGWVVDEVEMTAEFSAAFPEWTHPLKAPHKVGDPPTAMFNDKLVAAGFSYIAELSLEQIQALYLEPPASSL